MGIRSTSFPDTTTQRHGITARSKEKKKKKKREVEVLVKRDRYRMFVRSFVRS
jgi:hypothetical protein